MGCWTFDIEELPMSRNDRTRPTNPCIHKDRFGEVIVVLADVLEQFQSLCPS